jgi:hypothetical protein
MAVTDTVELTVPALTIVCTSPLASLVALVGFRVTPLFTADWSAKFTVAPERGPLDESFTRNTTVEVSGLPGPPAPRRLMLLGVADTNSIEPIDAGATVTVPFATRD